MVVVFPFSEPTIQFEESVMHVNESSGFIFAPLIRTGGLFLFSCNTATSCCEEISNRCGERERFIKTMPLDGVRD